MPHASKPEFGFQPPIDIGQFNHKLLTRVRAN